MIILKIVGAVLILVSGYMIGRHIRDDLNKRVQTITYIHKALDFIDNKISIENAYLEDVLIKCVDEIYDDTNVNQPFSLFISYMDEKKMELSEAWEKACESLYRECDFMKSDEKNYISQIGSVILIADKERQSESLRRIIAGLEEIEKTSADKAKKDGGLAFKISMIFAVMLIVLII